MIFDGKDKSCTKNTVAERLFNTAGKVGDLWTEQDSRHWRWATGGIGEAQELVWKAYELLMKAHHLMLEGEAKR
tara:strand:+ start:3423 stop:3644 length:222 start_codon:yes stop_codon:yes gene_type:complete